MIRASGALHGRGRVLPCCGVRLASPCPTPLISDPAPSARSRQVYSLGSNTYSELCVGDTSYRVTATLWAGAAAAATTFVAIDAGSGFISIAVSSTGHVYTCGRDVGGSLGAGAAGDRTTPTMWVGVQSSLSFVQVFSGYANSYALTGAGHVYGVGSNTRGQLSGLPGQTSRYTPALLMHTANVEISGIAMVAGGFECVSLLPLTARPFPNVQATGARDRRAHPPFATRRD